MELHGLLNIDKPLGWTSHDVVGKLRRILGIRKIGHAGTLDPAATGVLIVGVGRATRYLDYVQSESKQYLAHIVLGIESESADIDGQLIDRPAADFAEPSRSDVESTVAAFTGTLEQIPPKFSAIKIDGEPIYRRARRGESVDVPKRQVVVFDVSVISWSYPDLVVSITCGSGFYVRSFARDVGEMLGTGAYLHHLVRTRIGGFHLDAAWKIDEIESVTFPEMWTSVATAIDAGIDRNPAHFLNSPEQIAWYHGRSIAGLPPNSPQSKVIRGFGQNGSFTGLGSVATSPGNGTTIKPSVVLPQSH
jgi:tRNA pseudouridine55 synthase